jgi:putative FmdB family regulatory protein
MPMYDYRCDGCGREFELQRPVAQRDDAECPHCRGRKVRRLVRAPGILGGAGATRGCTPSRAGFT